MRLKKICQNSFLILAATALFTGCGGSGGSTNTAPVADAQSLSTEVDTNTSIVLTGSDADGDALTYAAANPANGTLSGTAPNVIYTPDTGYTGIDSFTFTVNDGTVDSAAATIYITVTDANTAPVANAQSVTTEMDTAKAITLTGSDTDGDTLTYTTTDPANGTLSGTAPDLTYTPDSGYTGSDSFTFTVNDGTVDSAVATISITVTDTSVVNTAPIANAQSITTEMDSAKAITLTGSDANGDALTYATTTPTNGTLTGTAPDLTYTPNSGYMGSDSFTFTVNDGTVDSVAATVSITVTAINAIPVADAQSLSTNEDTEVAFTLTGSDSDSDPLTYTAADPANGTLTGTAPNLTYVPDLNFNGSDSFTFTVNDGKADSAEATVTINVIALNDAPVANNSFLFSPDLNATSATLRGSDVDGDNLTFSITSTPANGSVTLDDVATGAYTYTPSSATNGSFTFSVSDGNLSSSATVTITTTDPDPIADDQSITVIEDIETAITLTGSDVSGNALDYNITNAPSMGIINGTPPSITYIPSSNYHGTDSFTFTVNNGTFTSAEATIILTITASNDAPVAEDDNLIQYGTLPTSDTLKGSDVDGDSFTFTLATLPVNGSVTLDNASTGAYTYTPSSDQNDSFTFTINDGTVDSVEGTVTITYIVLPDTPANVTAVGGDQRNTISWDPVASADSYNVYWALISGAGTSGGKITNASSPYYDDGLSNGTPRYYVVTSVDASGESLISAEVSATPTDINISSLDFSDANLKTCVNFAAGDANITYVHELTYLDCANRGISDTNDIDQLNGLLQLYLENNSISNIQSLAALTNLTRLDLYSNTISDVSPLTGITSLDALDLFDNSISDVSPLTTLISLTYLGLDYNAIIDVSPLATLTKIEKLALNNNNIGGLDVGNVDTLTTLTAVFTVVAPAESYIDLTINPNISCSELQTLLDVLSPKVTPTTAAAGTTCTDP